MDRQAKYMDRQAKAIDGQVKCIDSYIQTPTDTHRQAKPDKNMQNQALGAGT